MSLDFLKRHGGRRLSAYPAQPPPEDETPPRQARQIDLSLELMAGAWRPIDVGTTPPAADERPRRYVDGSYYGENIAWLRGPQGHPIPVRLAELGGICVRIEERAAKREAAVVERVVASLFDPFPWEEVEAFADGLTAESFHLLPLQPHPLPRDEDESEPERERPPELSFEFRRNSEAVRIGVLHHLTALEEAALFADPTAPTVVDGRIGRFQAAGVADFDVIGVIKRQAGDYLHPEGYLTLLDLKPGQRTPIFRLPSKHLPVVSWYLKLAGADGAMPDWGYIRVEISDAAFARHGRDAGYISRLSQHLITARCRQGSYPRGPVSLEPIVRAEDCLKALFLPLAPLTQHFFRLTGI